jgi:hypothetical protein
MQSQLESIKRKAEAASSVSALFQQRGETCLLEMSISGEDIMDAMFLYHNKADAISKRPVFILPLTHELHTLIKQLRTQWHNGRARAGAKTRHEREKISMVGRTRAGIPQFQENKFGGDDGMAGARPGKGAGMHRIVAAQQRKIEGRVGENGAHDFFGSPLT